MRVKLISVTQPCAELREQGIATAEDLIVYTARVSNPQNQLNVETGGKLLNYCMEHGHWSVFEQASMGMEIVTSRAISAQILRHRSFHFQEFSQRYSAVHELEPIQLRKQAEKNRQSSSEPMNSWHLAKLVTRLEEQAQDVYRELITYGVARECARMVLPLSTQTTIYMTGTVRDWIHYIRLRTKPDTQLEHRQVAEAVGKIFVEQFPNIAV
jgi:thymidylate synthase (FAD)